MSTEQLSVSAHGTYVKRSRMKAPFTMGAKGVLLYLLPSGRFLFVGYRRGWEYWVAAGHWRQSDSRLHLTGRGSYDSDCISANFYGHPFQRSFTFTLREGKKQLIGDVVENWGLLGAPGKLYGLGEKAFVRFLCGGTDHLPEMWEDMDDWIDTLFEMQQCIEKSGGSWSRAAQLQADGDDIIEGGGPRLKKLLKKAGEGS